MRNYRWQRVSFSIGWGLTSVSIALSGTLAGVAATLTQSAYAQSAAISSLSADTQNADVETIAQSTTVRILTPGSSGSGVIVARQGQVYTVLTNWHVIQSSDEQTIITPDSRRHTPISLTSRQLGFNDLAVVQFSSAINYQVTRISTEPVAVGDRVFASGFPIYQDGGNVTTFDLGIQAFRFTQGNLSMLLPKYLAQGYRLGYTNKIVNGMSGGPIFNDRGFLIGINGRQKVEDPAFAVYGYEDGTQPPPGVVEQMVNCSWGIPINRYLQSVSLPQDSSL